MVSLRVCELELVGDDKLQGVCLCTICVWFVHIYIFIRELMHTCDMCKYVYVDANTRANIELCSSLMQSCLLLLLGLAGYPQVFNMLEQSRLISFKELS